MSLTTLGNSKKNDKQCNIDLVVGSAVTDCEECSKFPCSLQEWSRDKDKKLMQGECGDKEKIENK